jgi:hypothetical protein
MRGSLRKDAGSWIRGGSPHPDPRKRGEAKESGYPARAFSTVAAEA